MTLAGERAGLGDNPDQRLPSCCIRLPWRLGHDTGVTSARTASVSLLTRLHRTDDLPITSRMIGVGLDGSRPI
jgi:hypothetical protein